MADNRLPNGNGALSCLGGQMLAGLEALGAEIGIVQITPTLFAEKLTAFTTADAAFCAARSRRQAAADVFAAADAALTAWLAKARLVLAAQWGQKWSTIWAQAGYRDASAAVPTTIAGRFVLAGALAAFFTANPGFEQPSVGVTADAAAALLAAAQQAREGMQQAATAAGEVKAVRESADTALRVMMRGLIAILAMLLTPDDPRWLSFGLNRPAARLTPTAPEDFTATARPDGTLALACAPTPLATRYRWRMKVLGADTDFRLAASTANPLALLDPLPPGRTVELCVQAVNGQAESTPSDVLTLEVPAVATGGRRLSPSLRN